MASAFSRLPRDTVFHMLVSCTKLPVLYGCSSTLKFELPLGTCQTLPTRPEQSPPYEPLRRFTPVVAMRCEPTVSEPVMASWFLPTFSSGAPVSSSDSGSLVATVHAESERSEAATALAASESKRYAVGVIVRFLCVGAT